MFGIDDILSKENQEQALEAFRTKRDGAGPDGLRVSEFEEYWKANHELIEQQIREGSYAPGIVKTFEVGTRSGKQREIASINVLDRFVEKLIQQQLQNSIDPLLLSHCFAYREGKGALDAAIAIRDYALAGKLYLCELDIRDYFGSIHLGRMRKLMSEVLDAEVVDLVRGFLTRNVEKDGKIHRMEKGILQGSSLSPALANLYLLSFDQKMEDVGLCWARFSDNIYVCCATTDEAQEVYTSLRDELGSVHQLGVNKKKSGIYEATSRRVLGYDLIKRSGGGIEVRKHSYKPTHIQRSWSQSALKKQHGAYHIVQDGVINRKDYSLLFENEEEKHYIPVGVTDQLNIYGNVTIAPAALSTITREGIRVAYLDQYGTLMGTYVPESHGRAADVFLKQCLLYNDESQRLNVARMLEMAGMHNMRENLRYYQRRKKRDLAQHVAYISACIAEANECKDIGSLVLIEARARKKYYEGFSVIVSNAGFGFTRRTRRPPKDPCNAMISFGNTVLYNMLLQIIWKTSLDPKIGVVHATNRRNYSLNLDFADLFKPVVVDRVIFSLVNRREMRNDLHFEKASGGGVFLTPVGKRMFLEGIEQKLDSRVGGKLGVVTYRKLMADEVLAFQRLVRDGEAYKPYKYY